LINKGADEPYRMFTSRAEFRLHLRIDNADERLTPAGRELGVVSDDRWREYQKKQGQKSRIRKLLEETRPNASGAPGLGLSGDDRPPLMVWLRRPEAKIAMLRDWLSACLGEEPSPAVLTTVETEAKYAGYISQQTRQIERLHASEGRIIPSGFGYGNIPGLSTEIRQKLSRVQPETLGQAARIPGVTPAAVAVLDVYLSLHRPPA
jgi:tRNA uridine 5-carboxymethylaminomethyl modification enzyme